VHADAGRCHDEAQREWLIHRSRQRAQQRMRPAAAVARPSPFHDTPYRLPESPLKQRQRLVSYQREGAFFIFLHVSIQRLFFSRLLTQVPPEEVILMLASLAAAASFSSLRFLHISLPSFIFTSFFLHYFADADFHIADFRYFIDNIYFLRYVYASSWLLPPLAEPGHFADYAMLSPGVCFHIFLSAFDAAEAFQLSVGHIYFVSFACRPMRRFR
jgi:hypothetical protein